MRSLPRVLPLLLLLTLRSYLHLLRGRVVSLSLVASSSDCSSYSFSDGSAKGGGVPMAAAQGKPTPKRLTKTEKGDISERLGKYNNFRAILTGMQLGDSCIH